ncbi:MAG TPA: VWA domain-containing protein [Pyrinomonadaceae bacterium]
MFIFESATPHRAVAQQSAPQNSTATMTLAVSVTDKRGAHIYGLKQDAFTLYDNKTPQRITSFVHQDLPASIGILFDSSGSLDKERLDAARKGLGYLFQSGNQASEYFLIGFNQRPQLLMDWTNDGAALLSKLKDVQPLGQTALFDACYVALDKLAHGKHQKHILILITDGQDNISRYSYDQVLEAVKRSDTVVYALGILNDQDPGSALGMHAQALLGNLSSVSGGTAFFPKDRKLTDESFDFIAEELRYQYLLSFTPAKVESGGKWHRLKIDVALPPDAPPKLKNVKAHTRDGYYALEKESR